MKNVIVGLGAFLALFMVSCDGDQGPQGPPGFDGLEGPRGPAGSTGRVIEFTGNFTPQDNYSILYDFAANGIDVNESEVVLVYLSFAQTEDNAGVPVEIWRLLPQTLILDQGLLQYNYDHTFNDVTIFLEADFDLAALSSGDIDNQYFRIAILPSEFFQTAKMDKSNLSSVMSSLGISENDVQKVKIK